MHWQMELQRRAEEEKAIHEADMQKIHDFNVGRKQIRRARMREQMEEAARLYDEAQVYESDPGASIELEPHVHLVEDHIVA